jgi:hypothetical protein
MTSPIALFPFSGVVYYAFKRNKHEMNVALGMLIRLIMLILAT